MVIIFPFLKFQVFLRVRFVTIHTEKSRTSGQIKTKMISFYSVDANLIETIIISFDDDLDVWNVS